MKYQIEGNFILFEELFSDSIGKNFRASEIKDKRATSYSLFAIVHSYLYQDLRIWKRVKVILEGIGKSKISGIYAPKKILENEITGDKYLVYDFIKGKSFEQIIQQSDKKNIPFNFELAFSLALGVADIIETGGSIAINNQKSFHGFLTPDNIIVDYDGIIHLKNYGICPYLDRNDEIFSHMEKHYGSWLTPEFIRREKIIPQSDIYHLGYILYRMLTGKYFSFSEDEDFEDKLFNISFTNFVPSTDKEFLTNLLTFFRKTLNPDPAKRFSNIKEFKDFISTYFHIEELSSVTFNLAYFMNSLYSKEMEEEKELEDMELNYEIPEEKHEEIEQKSSAELVEHILDSLDEKERSKKIIYIPIAIALIVAIISVFFYLQTTKKTKEEQEKAKLEMEKRMKDIEAKYQKQLEERMKAINQKIATTEEERKKQEEEKRKIQEELLKQKQRELELQKKMMEEKKKAEEEARKKAEEELRKKQEEEKRRIEEEAKRKAEEEKRKKILEAMKTKKGDLVPLNTVDKKPQKVVGKNLFFSKSIRDKYVSKRYKASILTSILIDENGRVVKVKFIGKYPKDIEATIKRTLLNWKYKPAIKDGVEVKVWKTVRIKVNFEV